MRSSDSLNGWRARPAAALAYALVLALLMGVGVAGPGIAAGLITGNDIKNSSRDRP